MEKMVLETLLIIISVVCMLIIRRYASFIGTYLYAVYVIIVNVIAIVAIFS